MNWLILISLVVSLLAFVLMLSHKDLLRDTVQEEEFEKNAIAQKNTSPKKPFSLAKVQIAIWTIIIIFSYIDVYFSNGWCGNLTIKFNDTALALLGISIGTVAVAGTIDNIQQNNTRHQNQPSQGFLIDILSDENGISIHRFQVILFTIVAIIFYINKIICKNNELPKLDDTLLGIITISYSGYLGMKINENKKTVNTDSGNQKPL